MLDKSALRAALNEAIGKLIVLLLALLLALVGLGFVFAAIYVALASVMSAALAAVICGGGALILAFGLLLVARGGGRERPSEKAGTPATPSGDASGDAAEVLGRWLPVLRRHKGWALGGVFATGLLLGVSPRARKGAGRLIDRLLSEL